LKHQIFFVHSNFLIRPHELPATTDYHFFRDGVNPTWEDPYNSNGGRWTIRLPKKGMMGSRYWEEVLLSLLGGFPDVPDGEICGAVISVRGHEDVLSVWHKNSGNQRVVSRIKDGLKKLLRLPPNAPMRYHNHPRTPEN
jgi:translation initiation factor 4E